MLVIQSGSFESSTVNSYRSLNGGADRKNTCYYIQPQAARTRYFQVVLSCEVGRIFLTRRVIPRKGCRYVAMCKSNARDLNYQCRALWALVFTFFVRRRWRSTLSGACVGGRINLQQGSFRIQHFPKCALGGFPITRRTHST